VDTAPTREQAARILGVSAAAPDVEVKRAYRRLVRDHHPDAGGDPAAFQRLQRAYERLTVADPDAPPLVARGRPSRAPVPFIDETVVVDLGAIDWSTPPPEDGDPLSVDALARWLAPEPDAPLGAVRATSRAPGSRLNRVARHLATELTSTLSLATVTDDRGRELLGIGVTAATRRARRALEAIGAEDGWVRTRGSTTTSLRTTIGLSPDPRATAVRGVTRVVALLDHIEWPLHAWRAEVPGRSTLR
jgi:hypothetical protein